MSHNIEKQKIKALKEIYGEYITCLSFDDGENVKITDQQLINLITEVKWSIWRLRKPKWESTKFNPKKNTGKCINTSPIVVFKTLVKELGGPSKVVNRKGGVCRMVQRKIRIQ